jgi:multicomponent Na+:H+ antiporter subunit G
MMALALDILSWVMILVGGAFGIIGGIGLLRFPDFFTRIHAAGITDTMCAPLIIGGLMLQSGLTLTTVKLFFLIVFLFLTSPTASHALAKAALHGGEKPILAKGEPPTAGQPGPGRDGGKPTRDRS